MLGIAGEQLIRTKGADDFMLAGTNILDFAAREDKDPTDSAWEIGEEGDLYWQLLLRIGRACLRVVDWLAGALINGRQSPDS